MNGKENMASVYTGILFSVKKEGSFDITATWMNLYKCYAKGNKSVIKGRILCDSTYMTYLEYSVS